MRDELSSPLPQTWARVPLGEVADVQLGKMLSTKSKTGRGSRPYLRNVNVRWGRIDTTDMLSMDFDEREVAKYELRPGDVLVCEGGEPGRAAVWNEQLTGALYQKALHRVRSRDGLLEPRYLVYQLEHDTGGGELTGKFTGSTIKHLPREVFLSYEIALAPVSEQRRIVAAIEEHLSDLDAAVAALKRVRVSLRGYRNATLKAGVEGALSTTNGGGPLAIGDELGAGWSWRTVGELTESSDYGSSSKTDADIVGVPVLRMGNIVDGRLDLSNLKYLPEDHAEFPRLLLRSGDVLFNRTNSPELVGKTAVFREQLPTVSFASYLIRIRTKPELVPEFLSMFINSIYGRSWVKSVVSQQVGQANVNGSKLRALRIPVPPVAEQMEIVAEVERRLAVADRTDAEVETQLARAARLRQSILARAFAGKLVPQDPSDEPASALLERIRAARAAEPVQRRPRSRRTARPRTSER